MDMYLVMRHHLLSDSQLKSYKNSYKQKTFSTADFASLDQELKLLPGKSDLPENCYKLSNSGVNYKKGTISRAGPNDLFLNSNES
jgi:hypothetical protein